MRRICLDGRKFIDKVKAFITGKVKCCRGAETLDDCKDLGCWPYDPRGYFNGYKLYIEDVIKEMRK